MNKHKVQLVRLIVCIMVMTSCNGKMLINGKSTIHGTFGETELALTQVMLWENNLTSTRIKLRRKSKILVRIGLLTSAVSAIGAAMVPAVSEGVPLRNYSIGLAIIPILGSGAALWADSLKEVDDVRIQQYLKFSVKAIQAFRKDNDFNALQDAIYEVKLRYGDIATFRLVPEVEYSEFFQEDIENG